MVMLFLPFLGLPIMIFWVGMDHFDYPWSHQVAGFRARLRCLSKEMPEFLGFSCVYLFTFMVPILGLFTMPLAVVSAALLVHQRSLDLGRLTPSPSQGCASGERSA